MYRFIDSFLGSFSDHGKRSSIGTLLIDLGAEIMPLFFFLTEMYKRCINSGDALAFNRLIIHTRVRCGYIKAFNYWVVAYFSMATLFLYRWRAGDRSLSIY